MSMKLRAAKRGERGQVLTIFALFLVVLLVSSALAIDYGSWLKSRREYQNLADAAVLAGITQLADLRGSTACVSGGLKARCARQAAWTSLKEQLGLTALDPVAQSASNTPPALGYEEAGYRIWVDSPASAAGTRYPGAYVSQPGTLFTWVERNNPSFMGRIVGQGDPVVSAWANGGLVSQRAGIAALCDLAHCIGGSPANIKIAGVNSGVRLIDGDVFSNTQLQVTSGTSPGMILPGDSQAYLLNYLNCATSTWSCPPGVYAGGGIQDGGSPALHKPAQQLRLPVVDPNYPLPSFIDNLTALPLKPPVDASTGYPVDPTTGSPCGGGVLPLCPATVRCAAGSPTITPGTYDTINVRNSNCLVLNPIPTAAELAAGVKPGIFRIRNQLNMNQDSWVIGDGVSLFFDATAALDTGTRGGYAINVDATAGQFKAGWTTTGDTPWTVAGTTATYDPNVAGTGMTFYVRKPTRGTTAIFTDSGNSAVLFRGVLYAPKDDVRIGGSSTQSSAGLIWAWTIEYNGVSVLQQLYEGSVDERPLLLEPTLGQ